MKVAVASKSAARLFHEGVLCLSRMEAQGVRIDTGYLAAETKKVESEIDEIKKRMEGDRVWSVWRRRFGNSAKINSREQMADVVFGVMGMKRGRSLAKKDKERGGRRQPALDEASFSECDLDFVKDFFKWKKLEKLLTTYFRPIARETVGGRLHPSFSLHTTVSYRSSSSDPNLHNIPNRNKEIAGRIRRCFIPDEGCAFVEADFSGAEVRSACCYTADPRLIEDFTQEGKDPHGDTAEMLFGIDKSEFEGDKDAEREWKKGPRDWSKNRFVFPQFFGSCYFQCAPHIWDAVRKGAMMPRGKMTIEEHLRRQGITSLGDCDPEAKPQEGTFVHRVKKVEDSFWNERFSVYNDWKKRWYAAYLRKGFFRSLSGFVYSGLLNRNDVLNYAIQGYAFHWLLWSIIEVDKELRRFKMRSRLWNEVHDSMNANVPEGELDDFCDLVYDVMVNRCPLHFEDINVDLAVDVEVSPPGTSWADKESWKRTPKGWRPKSAA